ncbi:MAG: bifunctional pyr operon transcriptional regulator/uracil phosphoribosyltransferase PyrR [Gammaproteobacteria bacterium]|nr:MAG: bifunctional pyr operon transcriptional regulator/uracil phosphoribosyltransferase PyrR [Gammaproteobacteria bacterium]RKZ96052.1 MAG: bifunctional pyr operon transcriptional regulator/uracil phosphoribosyltransferase PyrR [Gammaproteobacteria bacterium]RKZ97819.1 MAG: bifunctional pyr operon transcriptional regulator/uracil phosphoribosyltransferase PyrR [Gammaproteobacteria bacterium]RLA01663.1 MAG: bifunctional pyr operon transcriptional regulator/uracil phosphoribosyltransferase PyrR
MTIPSTPADIHSLLESMADNIRQQLGDKQPLLIGIHTGGVWIAKELANILGADFFDAPLGSLNIAYYRDDFTRIGMHPQVTPSDLPFGVDDRHLLLVDDVLHSGRTVRAALNEIFDYGRPASVTLAALIERTGRELPIQADIIGQSINLTEDQHIKLTNDDGLQIELKSNGGLDD